MENSRKSKNALSIRDTLYDVGLDESYIGFPYMLAAIQAIQDGKPAGPTLMKEIAKEFGTSYERVYYSLSTMKDRICAINYEFYREAVKGARRGGLYLLLYRLAHYQ